MSVTWHTLSASGGRVEVVEGYPTLDDCLRNMALLAWEDAGNHALGFVTDDDTGEVVAAGLYGPGMELLVTCADGRQIRREMPEAYR